MAFLSLPRVSKLFGMKTVNPLLNAFGICRLLTEAKLLLLFSTLKNDRKIAADLSQVFVQMKISVIHSVADMDEIVPRISTFAILKTKFRLPIFLQTIPFTDALKNYRVPSGRLPKVA